MDKIQKLSNPECNIPLSEQFRNDLKGLIFYHTADDVLLAIVLYHNPYFYKILCKEIPSKLYCNIKILNFTELSCSSEVESLTEEIPHLY